MKKALKIILIVLFVMILLVALAVGAFCIRDRILYRDFYRNAEDAMPTPGIDDGYIPQGFFYVPGQNYYLACGYMNDDRPSRIYVLDDGDKCEYVSLFREDGSEYKGHAGGVACNDTYVYLTDAKGILLFLLADVLDGDGKATAISRFETIVGAAYVYVEDQTLFVGEFYYASSYETPEDHRLTTPSGEQNTALLACYSLDPSTGLPENEKPEYLISTPGMVQGMTFDGDGNLLLSTSWALNTSRIFVYDISEMPEGVATVDGESYEVYYLQSDLLIRTIEAPPMSEEIVYRADQGKLLIMTESASDKYFFGKLTSGRYVQAYRYDETK